MSTPFDSAISELSELDSVSDAEPNPEAESNETSPWTEGFCDQVAPQAKRYAMSIVRRWCVAEEIVQEAFCRLMQAANRQRITVDANSKAMLFTTVRNLAIDQLRKEGRRRFETIETSQLAAPNYRSDHSRLEQLESGVEEILQQMPTQWSDALQLKVNGGLSYAEITRVLGATHAQVRTWIYRARQRLEQELNQRGLLEDGEHTND
jgi:RNA polymerase sigma-70 factor (ECF subfamily)